MKITKKAFADILEKRLVDRIIFAHLGPGFCGIKLVRRQVVVPIFPFSFLLRSTRKNPNPIGLQSLTLWEEGLASGLQVVPYAKN